MTHQTILLHRGGYGWRHRLGRIEVRPEGRDRQGVERYYVRLDVDATGKRYSAVCVPDYLESVIEGFAAGAEPEWTRAERTANHA